MGSDAREADMDIMTQNGHADESTSPMVLLPPEIKTQILSYLSTQQSLSYLGQSCRAWHEVAKEELYKRDAREKNSFAIKWMAAHAVDEKTTDSAIRTLEISRRWGGQIDAVKPGRSQFYRASSNEDQKMYETSTALHFAVLLGNMRLTGTLLEMKASLAIPISSLLWKSQSMVSQEVLRRVYYFLSFLGDDEDIGFGSAFPIFLAFIQRDADMCKFLVEHGASRQAIIVDFHGSPEAISILHFAAADRTTDYRQWQCLFDGFCEYIDEPCPVRFNYTPLHIALKSGCTQGMQIAVESGADKEAKHSYSDTHLTVGVLGIAVDTHADPTTFEERTMCVRKFVELGASVNREGDSVLVLAVQRYVPCPTHRRLFRRLIYFLLDHHADINGTHNRYWQNTNVVNEIIKGILDSGHPPTQELLKELLSDFLDRGLNLTIPAPGLTSPLFCVLHRGKAKPEWLFDLLCQKGATIHEDEVDPAFLLWCKTSRLWEANEYNSWWKHQGQEEKIFLKWCEHPYNAWWWEHVKRISPQKVTEAYEAAFAHEDRHLYDILTHLPLLAPSDDVLVQLAISRSKCSLAMAGNTQPQTRSRIFRT